ncbi:MAG TPA: hypothetical protein VMX13_01715 [Sedimentisphaerales bacterium]|nr:hypothetical protein [Sedimentisphaerales bacterium]
MIKTLRITSVIAAIVAVGLTAFPMFFGFDSDEDIEQFLNSPSIIDQFGQSRGSRSPKDDADGSPLVAQAKGFAEYLNPAKPPPSRVAVTPGNSGDPNRPPPPPPPPPPPGGKFTVVATSVYESHPDMSLVLINEPGKGSHWVRQGAEVMHLTIEQVKEGVIVVQGGGKTYELAVPPVREVSLLEGASPVSGSLLPSTLPASIAAAGSLEVTPAVPVDARITGGAGRTKERPPLPPGVSEEERARAEKIFTELEAMYGGAGGPAGPSPGGAAANPPATPPMPAPEAGRITADEVERLDNLGKELKEVQRPDRTRDRYGSRRSDGGRRDLRDPRERINQRLEERRKRMETLAKRKIRGDETPEPVAEEVQSE